MKMVWLIFDCTLDRQRDFVAAFTDESAARESRTLLESRTHGSSELGYRYRYEIEDVLTHAGPIDSGWIDRWYGE